MGLDPGEGLKPGGFNVGFYGIACARLSDSTNAAKIRRAGFGEGAVAGNIRETPPNRPLCPQPPRIFFASLFTAGH